MTYGGEKVYVVRRADLFPAGAPRGCVRAGDGFLDCIRDRGFFAPRDDVEMDPSLKQVIPYAVLARADEVFVFRRTDKGGERRLHGLRSIGVGGHVNPCDSRDVVVDALRREIGEELHVPAGWTHRIVGLINDDATAVGSVHVGVVAIVDPGEGVVRVREADMMSGSFVGRTRLRELHATQRGSFEGWSALLLDRLDEVLGWARLDDSCTPTRSTTRISTT